MELVIVMIVDILYIKSTFLDQTNSIHRAMSVDSQTLTKHGVKNGIAMARSDTLETKYPETKEIVNGCKS